MDFVAPGHGKGPWDAIVGAVKQYWRAVVVRSGLLVAAEEEEEREPDREFQSAADWPHAPVPALHSAAAGAAG